MIRIRAFALAVLIGVIPAFVAVNAHAQTTTTTSKKKKKKKKKKADAAAASTSTDTTLARPADQDTSTRKLEDKLKKAEANDKDVETTVLAPVKLDVNGPLTKDDKADRARDLEIDRIKKILPKMKDPNIKADLMFQLAEAWWQKSRYIYQFKEMPPFLEAQATWANCHKGRKACGPEPRPNTTRSESLRSSAVDIYKQLIASYKNYPRLDEVYFILGYNKMDLAGQVGVTKKEKDAFQKEALAAYRNIITNYPKSKFVCDANVELGNYFFDNNQLGPAEHAFQEGLNCRKTQTYATYKLAWCDYNNSNFKFAIKRFKDVIDAADKPSGKSLKKGSKSSDDSGNRVRLKSEALRDLVMSFQKAGELDGAVDYYKKVVGVDKARRYIVSLAGKYFDAGGYDYANRLYRSYLIKGYPTDPSAPEWQTKIVIAYDKQGQRSQVRKEIEALVKGYGAGSSWAKEQKSQHDRDAALSLMEEALYNLVTDYHQEAIKTKVASTYKLARDIYKEYLDHFPTSERAYAMRFYYAEILYALEDYQAAYDQYVLVAHDKGKQQDYKLNAAKDMLLSAEKLVDIEDGNYKVQITDDSSAIDESKAKGDVKSASIKAKVDKNKSETELTKLEKQLVSACDEYVTVVPKADDEAAVRLRAAVIYFFKAQYVEASNRFGYIIKSWPQDPSSADAALLILEALEAKQEWAELNKRATEFSENAKLLEGTSDKKKELRKRIPINIEGSAFKLASITNEKDHEQGAKLFGDFADKYPSSKFTCVALYNSFINYQNAKQLDQAIKMGELMLQKYAKCDSDDMRSLPGDEGKLRALILPDLTFRLAKTYELTADFASAAKYYELYMAKFPTEKNAPDAQYNAGLWYRGLGLPEKAIPAWEKYIKIYQAKTPKDREELKLYSDADVTWEIASILEDQKLWAKAILKINEYMGPKFKVESWKALRAKYHQMLAFKEQKNAKQFAAIGKDILERCAKLSDADRKQESSKLACAYARFNSLQARYDAYTKLKFKYEANLKSDLEKFTKDRKALAADYLEVVKDGNGDWAIAALVRIAQLPRLLAKAVRESPIPKKLTPDQVDMYKSALEDKATEIETPAIDLLEKAMAKSFELGIYNDWTLEAEKAMAEFKPDLFIEPKELPIKGSEFFFTAHTPVSASKAGSGGD